MNYDILTTNIVGDKNKRQFKNSQDYSDYVLKEEYIIITVSDGHSTSFFDYSEYGAKLACESLIEVLENNLESLDKKENLSSEIYNLWNEKVAKDFYDRSYRAYKVPYLRYSTTLIGVVVTKDLICSIKIGDGKIFIRQDDKYQEILSDENRLIVESLGRTKSNEFIRYDLRENYNIKQILICTDGYEKVFKVRSRLLRKIEKDYLDYNKDIFRRNKLFTAYKNYLLRLNPIDDISMIQLMKKA